MEREKTRITRKREERNRRSEGRKKVGLAILRVVADVGVRTLITICFGG